MKQKHVKLMICRCLPLYNRLIEIGVYLFNRTHLFNKKINISHIISVKKLI